MLIPVDCYQSVSLHIDKHYFPPVFQSVQSVFRSLTTLEKTVEKCHIDLDKQKDRLTFTLHCKHGISDSLHYQIIQSVFHI